MDVTQYLEIFLDETKEHLQSLSDQFMILEQEPDNMDTINEIFRSAHTLKGMAGTMGYKRMQTLTHDMENVFSEVRNNTIKVDGAMVDLLFQCLDALEEYTENIQNTGDEGTNDNEHLIKALNDYLAKNSGDGAPQPAKEEKKEPAKEEPKQEAGADPGKEKWREIKLGDTEHTVIAEAKKQGKKCLGVTVYVQESCILKAARAFLVYKALEELGDMIVSVPSAQDIEDEHFEFDFSVIILTDADVETVKNAILNVSEIEAAYVGEVEPVQPEEAVKPAAIAEAQPKEEEQPKKAAPAAPAKAADKKPISKPIVNRTVRVDIEKLDVLMNLVSELIIAKNSLVSTSSQEGILTNNTFNEQIEYLESVTTNLHESVMKVRMVPIETVVQKFPKMIRDLSKKLDKKMQLIMSGEETELDRTVVDEIGDPLMHLLRNSADHGLESAEVRKERGKPEVGSIFLNAYQDGNNVIIEVRDDGNGIDVEAVKKKAIERGTITPEQAENMADKDVIGLLFLPSFSTSEKVTDVSGRGVGLDVVKSKIESLSGEVEVKTKLGEGSTFIIRLPLTLAIIQALMVEVGGEKYAIPLGSIQTIEDVEPAEIKYVQAKEVINLRGTVIPLIRLNEVLDNESTKKPDENLLVIIVKKGDKLAGLVVDELMGQQEIVIKSLGNYINKNKIISGATILGDGEIALILDTNALL
ncbi:MAG TPA: chemotaxis protein CheA [Lachnospiraceae bacterium]|jgi:two-component system chemotaxis sensor kinase CheA|nr:MAG: chemotaxis protein CheA [Firmicutes bacterium CAG_194_44_15]HCI17648.1 chemotaxis protein CheA [Lachnospiraceae bacterium]HCX42784.1 chemotaxis protein CheA [Lachnospiraceae bacterium]